MDKHTPVTGYFLVTDQIEGIYNDVLQIFGDNVTSYFTKPRRKIITSAMDFWFFDLQNDNPTNIMCGVGLDIIQVRKTGFIHLNKEWRQGIINSTRGNPDSRIIIDMGG